MVDTIYEPHVSAEKPLALEKECSAQDIFLAPAQAVRSASSFPFDPPCLLGKSLSIAFASLTFLGQHAWARPCAVLAPKKVTSRWVAEAWPTVCSTRDFGGLRMLILLKMKPFFTGSRKRITSLLIISATVDLSHTLSHSLNTQTNTRARARCHTYADKLLSKNIC